VSKPEKLRIEVAYAEVQRQFLRAIELPAGATVADAIRVSEVESECHIDATGLRLGVWSKPTDPACVLSDGDRVELYRPLKIDPKEARRRRAGKRQPLAR
jgi:uncharacterized protein